MNSPLTSVSPQVPPFTGYGFESSRFFPQQPTPPDDIFDDENQVPSPEEFEAIVEDYLNNLSPKKRDKALVDQERYQLIQQVLRDPRNTSISTAQFRFWVKKMFQLQPGSVDLVCHDSKPVAMREQIYPILVRAHREAHHGGRDKTSALVRRRYSWIPKELVARFVRQCPFCITRRNGGQSPGVFASKALRHNVNRHSFCGFDTAPPLLCTPQLQEDSDISTSSGPPSADHGFDASPQYLASPPRRGSFFYDREEEDLLQSYQQQQQQQYSTTRSTIHPSLMTGLRTDPIQSAPQSPIYYSHQGYMGYYYPTNMLGIAPCENNNNNNNNGSNNNNAVNPFLRPDATDILAHQDDHSTPYFTTNATQHSAATNQFTYNPSNTHDNTFDFKV